MLLLLLKVTGKWIMKIGLGVNGKDVQQRWQYICLKEGRGVESHQSLNGDMLLVRNFNGVKKTRHTNILFL